jgi:hypothetical protein
MKVSTILVLLALATQDNHVATHGQDYSLLTDIYAKA